MANTIQPIHDELDYILEKINEVIEIEAEFIIIKLDEMVCDFNYEQDVRMALWEWEQDLIYG